MADYEKMTVANLRALLKDRGIPSTGLTRKAQIIERLIEEDNQQNATVDASKLQSSPYAHPSAPSPVAEQEVQFAPETSNVPADDLQSQMEAKSSATTATLPPDEAIPPLDEQGRPSSIPTIPSKEPDVTTDAPPPMVAQDSLPSQVDSDELAEDQRKRKRRSATPPVKAVEIEAKRLKLDNEEVSAQVQSRNSSPPVPDTESGPGSREVLAGDCSGSHTEEFNDIKPASPLSTVPQGVPILLDNTFGEAEQQQIRKEKPTESDNARGEDEASMQTTDANITSPMKRRHTETRENRFPGLVKRDSTNPTNAVRQEEDEDLPTVSPALHPATAALYIKNFQRPLREEQLRDRLLQLAGADDALNLCYLDPVRTHALALFTSVSTASRVRSAMHERVWPQERDRKPLWVDFVPEQRVQEWIDIERGGGVGPRAGGKRWEVVFETMESGDMGARLQEVGSSGTTSRRPTAPDLNLKIEGTARSPSPHARRPIPERQAPTQPAEALKKFQTLDSLFKSTSTTKPKLYYMPVAADLAERRLREIAGLTKRDWNERDRRPNDELRRYTFEDDDVLVDGGGHFMSKKQMAKEGITSTGTANPTARSGPPRRGRGRGPPPNDRYRGNGYADADDPYSGERRAGQSYRPR